MNIVCGNLLINTINDIKSLQYDCYLQLTVRITKVHDDILCGKIQFYFHDILGDYFEIRDEPYGGSLGPPSAPRRCTERLCTPAHIKLYTGRRIRTLKLRLHIRVKRDAYCTTPHVGLRQNVMRL